MEMTDLAVVRRCAEVSGLLGKCVREAQDGRLWLHVNPDLTVIYDPLTDDAQCFALLKRFPIAVSVLRVGGYMVACDGVHGWKECSDLNRCICECVARLEDSTA